MHLTRLLPLGLLALSTFALGCDDDDAGLLTPTAPTVEVPDTYSFDNVSYTGQQERLAMLAEMKAYMNSVKTFPGVDGARLLAMYANEEGANFSRAYSKDLRSKTLAAVQDDFDGYLTRYASITQKDRAQAAPGVSGPISTADGDKTYVVDSNGVEWVQIIEKGLMGATFYYQATSVYMGEDRMSADNETVVPGEGTAMEHHWDEALGYFGVPRDFPANTDGVVFWGDYCNDRDADLGTNALLMDALLKGRAAISAGNLAVRDEAIAEARAAWELVAAGTAIHYLNLAEATDDVAVRLHTLTEAVAFAYALPFNEATRLDRAAYREWLEELAGGVEFESIDLYDVSDADIVTAREQLAAVYGLEGRAAQL